jgi:hypothetical protein
MNDLGIDIPAGDRMVTRVDNHPDQITLARDTYRELNNFLKETPAVTNAKEAKDAARWLESVKVTLEELDGERRGKVDPLNAQVKAINDAYRPARESLDRLLAVLRDRLNAFARAQEAARAAEAARLAAEAAEAERLAREAEAREQDAIAAADVGECGIDIGQAIEQADASFADYKVAARAAAIAERAVPVRFGSALGGRSMALRAKETLTVDDPIAALKALAKVGLSEKLVDAILSDARAYRKLKKELPAGISSSTQRSL